MAPSAQTPGPVPVPLLSRPGIKRDGTIFEGDFYIEGEWVRWKRGLPRKMAGYRQITDQAAGIVRGINSHPTDNELLIHLGAQATLEKINLNVNTFVPSTIFDRTPSGFATDANNMWQFDQIYDASASFTAGTTNLIAHAAPNALDIASVVAAPVYVGDIAATGALTAIPSSDVSGGVVCLFPYLFIFGSDGYMAQSVANNPTDLTGAGSNQFRATSKKIVRGMPLRGGAANAPSGLFWSLDSIIRASFVGGTPIFSFDTMSNQNGILAANSVVEHDGIYYWIGLGRFMAFNGVVQELRNDLNSDFFFENLNWPYRNKVFSFKVARYGEIWWCFPFGSSTEPDWAVIYNIPEQTWYDTPLPNGGRAAAENAASYRFPLASGVATDSGGTSILWQHEIGLDEISGSPQSSKAIRSFFTTGDYSRIMPGGSVPPANRAFHVAIIEPDFVQAGDMTVQVVGNANARAATVASEIKTFPAVPNTPHEQVVMLKTQRREMRFRFESNTLGGNYRLGQTLVHIEEADGTILGGVEQ